MPGQDLPPPWQHAAWRPLAEQNTKSSLPSPFPHPNTLRLWNPRLREHRHRILQQARSLKLRSRQDVIHYLWRHTMQGMMLCLPTCSYLRLKPVIVRCKRDRLPRCLFSPHWSSFNSKGLLVYVGTRASIHVPVSETWRLSQGSPHPPAAKPRHLWVSKAVLFWGQETVRNGDI